MIEKLVGAAVLAAMVLAVAPASAAKRMAGCSGPNLAKVESTLEASADGDNKWAAEKEFSLASDALVAGKMGECAVHLNKAMQLEAMK